MNCGTGIVGNEKYHSLKKINYFLFADSDPYPENSEEKTYHIDERIRSISRKYGVDLLVATKLIENSSYELVDLIGNYLKDIEGKLKKERIGLKQSLEYFFDVFSLVKKEGNKFYFINSKEKEHNNDYNISLNRIKENEYKIGKYSIVFLMYIPPEICLTDEENIDQLRSEDDNCIEDIIFYG